MGAGVTRLHRLKMSSDGVLQFKVCLQNSFLYFYYFMHGKLLNINKNTITWWMMLMKYDFLAFHCLLSYSIHYYYFFFSPPTFTAYHNIFISTSPCSTQHATYIYVTLLSIHLLFHLWNFVCFLLLSIYNTMH